MIFPSATCFSLLRRSHPLLALTLASRALAADFTGTIALESKGAILANPDRSGAVIWLEPLGDPVKGRPDDPLSPVHERMLQKNKMFSPHVLAVPVRSTVDFPNLDPIYHNAFSNFHGQTFDVSLYPPGSSRSVVFHRPGVVRVFCNIHPAMSAVIVVMDTPFFGITDRAGRYVIHNVPPGAYRRRVFFERATQETMDALTLKVDVSSASAAAPPLTISETGFIPAPHMNKYGRPYPKSAGEDAYSSPR